MNNCYPFVNTPLPYEYKAMEPYIDELTMHLHHDRHLQTYIDNLNAILAENPALQHFTLQELIMRWNRLPRAVRIPIRNNAGGVFNHRFYFDGMGSSGELSADASIRLIIEKQFQSFENFISQFKEAALSVFGSGYAWLISERGRLMIVTTPNQNTPDLYRQSPLLNIDVWEHAYYLKHYNLRAAYIDDWFNVVNWNQVARRYQQSLSGRYIPIQCEGMTD